MSLACAGLPVDKVGAIIPVQDVHDQGQGRLLKHLQLARVRPKDRSEDKIVLSGLFGSNVEREHLRLVWSEPDAAGSVLVLLVQILVRSVKVCVSFVRALTLQIFDRLNRLNVLELFIPEDRPHSDVHLHTLVDWATARCGELVLRLQHLKRVLILGHWHSTVRLLLPS